MSVSPSRDDFEHLIIEGLPYPFCLDLRVGEGELMNQFAHLGGVKRIIDWLPKHAGSNECLFTVNVGRMVLLTEKMRDHIESICDVFNSRFNSRVVGH